MKRKRKVVLGVVAGAVAVAAPAAASASMAYVTAPKDGRGTQYVMVADDAGANAVRIDKGVVAQISPDGARIAYAQSGGRTASAPITKVRDLASGATATVTGACQGWGLTWSPDSRWLACLTQSVSKAGDVTGGGIGLVALPASMAGVTSLPATDWLAAKGNQVGSDIAFSPDSQAIAYSSQPASANAPMGTLYVAPVANPAAKVTVLTKAGEPEWGPNGIVASRYARVTVKMGPTKMKMDHYQLWFVNPDGTGAAQLTHYRASGFTAGPVASAWSADGSRLAGGIVGQDQGDVASWGFPGGAMKMLYADHQSMAAAISLDGTKVLYSTGQGGGDAMLRIVNATGGSSRTIVKWATGPSVTANWNG